MTGRTTSRASCRAVSSSAWRSPAALVNQPSLILADEPTGNLDTKTSIEVMSLLQELREKRSITIVLITHDMDVARYGTRIVSIRDGLIVSDKPNVPMHALESVERRVANAH